jgi:hypothetical protein
VYFVALISAKPFVLPTCQRLRSALFPALYMPGNSAALRNQHVIISNEVNAALNWGSLEVRSTKRLNNLPFEISQAPGLMQTFLQAPWS